MQTHLHSFFVCRDKGCSPFPDTGEEGTASTGKIYSLLLGSQREGKELFLCLLFLNCLQLNIILVVKVKCFGVTYSDPSGWWRRASAVSEIHSLTSVGMMVLQIARGQMPVIKCQNGHGYSTGQLSLMVIIIRPCCKACRILFPWPGIEPGPSAMEAWSLNHWTAREFPWVIIKIASSVFMHVCVCVLSCVQLFMTPWTWPRQAPPWNFSGQNAGVHCHFLLQGIFLTQGSNPHLLHILHWQEPSLPTAPPGKPEYLWWLWIYYDVPRTETDRQPTWFLALTLNLVSTDVVWVSRIDTAPTLISITWVIS